MYGTEGTNFGGSFLLVAARSVFPKSRGGGVEVLMIDAWNREPLKGLNFPCVFWCTWTSQALLCQIIFLNLYFVGALCALIQVDLSCAALTLLPREGRDSRWG